MEEDERPNKKRKLEEKEKEEEADAPRRENQVEEQQQIPFVYTGQSKDDIPENITHVTVGDSVQRVGEGAFKHLRSIRSVTVSSNVEIIDKHAFYHCRALAKVHLHEGLATIATCAFDGCLALVEIHLPTGLKIIRSAAFRGCKSLVRISVPGTVKFIKKYAFQNCSSLRGVQLNEGLEFIACGVFCGCTALSAIALPITLQRLDCPDIYENDGPFEGCSNLLGVEIPADAKVSICENCFYLCERLMSISIPASATVHRKAFHEACGSLRTRGALTRLRNRFAQLPVHNACYYSSQTSIEDLLAAFGSAASAGNAGTMEDDFGMTPFHLVATSVKLLQDILLCLLDHYPVKVLERKDKRELTMMDYLLKHTSSKAVPLLKMTLYRAVVSRMYGWDVEGKWRLELSRLVEAIPVDSDTHNRRKAVCAVFQQVGYRRRIEVTSLLELALWKKRIREVQRDEGIERDDSSNYKVNCLCQSGAEVVIKSVFGFLWQDQSNLDTSLSIFPLCYLTGY